MESSGVTLFNAIMIETMGMCDNACYFCRYGQRRWQERRDGKVVVMSMNTITQIVNSLVCLKYTGRVSYYGISEPLLDARLPEILSFAKKSLPNAHHTIITNGNLLNQEIADLLFASGLDHMTVSAYDTATWQRAHSIKGGYINVKDRRPSTGYHWENRGGNIVQLRGESVEGNCARPFTGMYIDARGKVLLCCADLFGDVVIGDVHDDDLNTIWFNPVFARYRSLLSIGERRSLELCASCDHDGRGHRREGSE
ncbi:MAG: hypothetical protein CO029_02255 [Candidatus Magasanikbacteria bacterium CG_4_9_14_0_2_um_filter_41_10]|uniref:4Fe4S-binding SPASM domain-containing protein n=1 Tax=Candidatus Magasanikbacteria bacterium CG_4_10_14_0_2_um_filter_41_31 TaxID=1974639 RepID=A0A2M7V2R8_9BACT|nr:MAG: hypothetical protein AUJ37_04920 [Candidatus Magasanikbacteria bacterium CG1_02_41_34]PIZ92744.1 MAG: hypothetical protein COX83_03650 [Candidatus Magasanikbacteria bacterium CG_4_10_14_0_2_um_filter_41_31]PJC53541.1 MAG: hypothetical protein CO029_02255 [Candidatus Magasanikbacteria bacterium CG_4_9_14_0_2_um_filter_41_10]